VQALRLIVEWDGVVVEDRLFRRRPLVLVGAGPAATMVAAGPEGQYAAFVRRGDGWELRLPAGVVRTLAIPGQPDVDGAAAQRRVLALGGVEAARCGSLVFDGAVVSFELVEVRGGRRDAALWGWTAMALTLALVSGGGYRLVRAYGHGEQPKWGDRVPLSSGEATELRIRWNAKGPGASRPQAGLGQALHADAGTRPAALEKRPAAAKPTKVAHLGHTRPPRPRPAARAEQLSAAQAALLNADLRTTIDQLSRAAREAPLAYEQLNWLGLAHYMQAEYDDAERAWQEARRLDPQRADAVNNLANVAKRRGDDAAERSLIGSALALDGEDCHALNGLALVQAKAGDAATALATLARSDVACGGGYAYTSIQRAALLALAHDRDGAFAALETGLAQVDTLVPIKEYEVWMDLTRDPAFASLRDDARFVQLTTRYLPRATATKGG
jgi:hypothetical protein